MKDSLGDKPAFATDPDPKAHMGMTLRQWLAGQALVGLCAKLSNVILIVELADTYALELIKRWEKENEGSGK